MKEKWLIKIAATHIEPEFPNHSSIYVILQNKNRKVFYVKKYEVHESKLLEFHKRFKKHKKTFVENTVYEKPFKTLQLALNHINDNIILNSNIQPNDWFQNIHTIKKLPEYQSSMINCLHISHSIRDKL